MVRRLIVIAAALVLAACSVTAHAADAGMLRVKAREAGVDKMVEAIRAMPLGDDHTVGSLIDRAVPAVTVSELLAGAEEELPARYFARNECEVTLRLAAADLRANVTAIVAKQTETLRTALADKRPSIDGAFVEITGTYIDPLPWQEREAGAQGVPSNLAGWEEVDAIDRVRVEWNAYKAAQEDLKRRIMQNLKDAQAVDALVARARAASKAYLAGGVCEVRITVSAAELIRRASGTLSKAASDQAAKALGMTTYDVAACVNIKGSEVKPDQLFQWEKLKDIHLAGTVQVEEETGEEAPETPAVEPGEEAAGEGDPAEPTTEEAE